MKATLIIGYGNPDRQDDGVALQVLIYLARHLNRPILSQPEESFYPDGSNPDFWFDLQLLPEMVPTIAHYERVCFIDAHTGNVPADIQLTPLAPVYEPSILTHHMTPATLLNLCQAVNGKVPRALLVSIRGHQFGFTRELSPQTASLVAGAVEAIENWMREIS